MKKKIGGFLFACVVVGATVGVINDSATEVKAGSKEIFKIVGESDVGSGDYYEVVHKKTGCHYLVSDYDNESMIQMWTSGGNGNVGKPYCEDVKK